MVMSFNPYRSYQDVEFAWLDSIPGEWRLAPIKYQYAVVGGSTPKSGEVRHWDGDIVWVTPADLSKLSTKYVGDSIRSITIDGLDSCGASLVPENSVIVSTRAPIGSLAIAASKLCTNQGCKALVPLSNKEDSRYLYYWLIVNSKSLNVLGKGTTFLEISGDVLAGFQMPVPSCVEQQTIANFLDHETAKIDTLIDKQQQLIKLLKEKRQAVISHAVTKGLNPDAPMKDSGVEWLGEVPEHWEISPLKFQTMEMQTGPFGSQLHSEDYVESEIPLINPAHMMDGHIVPSSSCTVDKVTQERLSRHKLKEGDLILARRGELGRCAVIKPEHAGWLCGTGSLKATLINSLRPDYAYMLINSEGVKVELSLESKGSTMENLNTETLGNIRLPVPPVTEQDKILQFASKIDLKYDRLYRLAIEQIDLLRERRSALISAAVTGKIDVRNWQAGG